MVATLTNGGINRIAGVEAIPREFSEGLRRANDKIRARES